MRRSAEGIMSKSQNPKEKLINIQKREKLKGLLITKFMKKYGIKNPEQLLQKEISKFLEGEKLTDADLKRLDEKLRKLLSDNQANETLRQNLTGGELSKSQNCNSVGDYRLPDLNKAETMSVHSKQSRMSGASHLSKYNDHQHNKQDCDLDEFETLSMFSDKKPLHRFDFSNEGDEWNAICLYNQKQFEEEKKLNKLKDMEIKRRTKDDLDNQIRQKLTRLNEDQLKNKEYDQILLAHCDHLSDLEQQKQLQMKQKVLKEKENRDKQLRDEKIRKRVDIVKEKKGDKELVKHLLTEMEKEKQIMLQKKADERDALQKTLKDNELNKVKQLEALKREREDDIRCTDEYTKILDKQENDRKEYFKNIERCANSFMSQAVGTVLKEMDDKNKDEEERMKNYLNDKERRAQEDDEKRKYQIHEGKRAMKSYLDMQVEDKKKMGEFEKTLNAEQARIWKIDTQKFSEQEKDINEQIRYGNVLNAHFLKSQKEMKKSKNPTKMSDAEYALNRNVLDKMKTSQ